MTYSEYINTFSSVFSRWNDYRISETPIIKRVRYCSAYALEYSDIIALKSYNTIVAWYDKNNEKLLVNGYYSATTQSHISKFMADFCSDQTFRINGYCDSKNRLAYGYGLYGTWKRKGNTDTVYFKGFNGNKCYITSGLNAMLEYVVSYPEKHW